MATIHVLFLKTRPDDFLLNRVTAHLGGYIHKNEGFSHVELSVPHASGKGYVSSSVYQNETVSLNQKKTFANPNYVIHSITVNPEQLKRLQQHMKAAHDAKIGFDHVGMFLSALPFSMRSPALHQGGCSGRAPTTFCSRYVTELLQSAHVAAADGLNPHCTTPSKLYRVLKERSRGNEVAGSVEYKQNTLTAAADLHIAKKPEVPMEHLFTMAPLGHNTHGSQPGIVVAGGAHANATRLHGMNAYMRLNPR